MTQTDTFRRAAAAFIDLVGVIRPEQWAEPALGSWTVRDLVGHTGRAITTVETYLSAAEPVAGSAATVDSAEEYYLQVFDGYTDHAAVAQRGVDAGRMLGADPVATLTAALARSSALLDAVPAAQVVTIGALSITLDQYLRTRIFELAVHGLDLAAATGHSLDAPASVLADAAALAARVACLRGDGAVVLFALTGRDPLRDGFSIF